MPLGLRKRGVKPAQAPTTCPPASDSSSATSTPTENVQRPSRREFIRNSVTSILRPTSGRSTRASTPAPLPSIPLVGELLQQEASDLWTKAYNELPVEYKEDLGCADSTDSDEPEKLEALKQLLQHAMEAKRENIASQWKLKWRGKEINVREKAEKLVGWITKFKEVVDHGVQGSCGYRSAI